MSYKLTLLFVFVGLLILLSSFRKERKKRIIFFGDSITEKGSEPTGYITAIKNILRQQDIDNYELINAGVGGNTIANLYQRIEEDVISRSPDIVVINIGVNDVWHKRTHNTGTDIFTFEKLYREVIKKLQAANTKLVLCTPAAIGEKKNDANEQDEDLDDYAIIIKHIGNDWQLPVCDARMLFKNYINEHNIYDEEYGILTTDGVHLNEAGNRLVADAIWKQMETMIK